MKLDEKIMHAGVVGAGGAGFPTHVKAKSKVEYLIANGAECEPLMHKDFELMLNFAPRVAEGMQLLLEGVKARKGFFGIKRKNIKAAEKIRESLADGKIEMTFLGDYYPAGDEYELVYEATGKLIPPRGIPLDVGCVVNNVETMFNIANAYEGVPVTKKFLSVNGAVKNPSAFWVPVGTSFKEVLKHAGGVTVEDYGIFVGGVMMGKLTFDDTEVVTKTTGGLIVLPRNHYLIERLNKKPREMNRIGKSACDQCSYCTELCPRYLLGYDVQPHKVMRSLEFTTSGAALWNQYADLCSTCGLCTLYSCPEGLYPREACVQSKAVLHKENIHFEQIRELKVHPMKENRRVPLKQLMKRIRLLDYDKPTPFNPDMPAPESVKILTKQHVGAPSVPVVKIGDYVREGDLIADIPENSLGAKIHSSIDGKVTQVTAEYIRIRKS
jgi:Na+-translocating ferredoxin:NAD+ oxidoreductase RnfC subunit